MRTVLVPCICIAPILITLGVARSQTVGDKNEAAKSPAPDIKVAANIPNAAILELAKPHYPGELRITGKAVVRVKVNRAGEVVSAVAVSGHPLLRSSVVAAARRSKFQRSSAGGRKYVTGTLTYIFSPIEESHSDLRPLVGRQVTLRGTFSLRGKVGPFVLVSGRPVYLVASGSFTWGERYAEMEGALVIVTGTLRFHPSPPASETVNSAVARTPDYFYFEAETVRVQPAKE